ncbi:hypothetical protein O59_002668 [Cellvibrio sp. BR]|nr:hypothetical protein O59_002668 [Cellvibrio sp. BR]
MFSLFSTNSQPNICISRMRIISPTLTRYFSGDFYKCLTIKGIFG